jgi:uncharacterized protein
MARLTSEHPTIGGMQRLQISLTSFLVLTFVFSWVGAIPVILNSWRPALLPAGMEILQLLMFFGTGLVTFLVTWWNDGLPGVRALLRSLALWRVGVRWYALVLLGPAVLFWSALQISTLVGNAPIALRAPLDLLASFGAIFIGYMLLNTEELAWRGYVLPRLLARYTLWRASLILGTIWALFHLPLFLTKGGHPAGYPFGIFLLMIIALSVIFTWVTRHTGGSLILAHILHQSFNAWAESIPFFPSFTGHIGPLIVTVGLLVLSALLIGYSWSIVRRRRTVAPVRY